MFNDISNTCSSFSKACTIERLGGVVLMVNHEPIASVKVVVVCRSAKNKGLSSYGREVVRA